MTTIANSTALGQLIRERRKALKLTLQQLSGITGTSTRFLSELENGRATAGFGLVLHVLHTLSLKVDVARRGAQL